jgi:imidazolonepropionase-like amidohydrolase
MLCGSETGFSITPYGHWHAREAELFVQYLGLTPIEAITCATRNGAWALGLDGRLGTLAAGQLADVLVVDGDPARDITVLGDRSRFRAVISRGRPVDLSRPFPERRWLPGETVNPYSARLLTWDTVHP